MLAPPSAPAWTILGVWISVKPSPSRYARKARQTAAWMRNTARSLGERSTTGRRDSSVSRFRSSFFLARGTGGGAAGRVSTVIFASDSSTPPGARDSARSTPVAVTVHSSVAPSRASRPVHTHWINPSLVRRVRKVTPPRSRRA